MANDPDNEGPTVKLNVKKAPAPVRPTTAAVAPKVTVASADTPSPAVKVDDGATVKKSEFLDRALARSEVKRPQAKQAIEAALAALSDALKEGEELQIPPLGKLKVVKSRDIGEGAQVLTLKLRTTKDSQGNA